MWLKPMCSGMAMNLPLAMYYYYSFSLSNCYFVLLFLLVIYLSDHACLLCFVGFQFNFEGRYDLVRFLKTIQKAGLYAHLRIGPYVCAEWNFGYFPSLWI